MLVALAAMPVAAQDSPAPRAVLGKIGNDPAGCDATPELIRQLYAECARTGDRAGQATGAARSLPAERPASSGATTPMPAQAGMSAERIERAPRRAPPTTEAAARTPPDSPRCRDILLRLQLGEEPSDADLAYLRSRCRARE
jgi:hypothetical protein